MAKLQVLAGSTSQSVNVFVRDSSSGAGAGLAAVAPAGGSLLTGSKLYYSFTGANASAGVAVALAVLAAVNSAWSSAGIVTLDATNMVGWVRIDIPNAALAASSGRVVSFLLWGGTNMAPTPFEIELTATNNQSATAFITSVATVSTVTNQLTAAQIATGVWQDATGSDFTTASSIGKSLYTTGAVPGATGGLFIAGTNAATTITGSLTTTFTGSLTGSVTGTVGGVAGVTFPAVVAAEPQGIKKNTARTITCPIVSSTDHLTPVSGLTITATRSIDGGAFAVGTVTVTEIAGTGYYNVILLAADLNGDEIVVSLVPSGTTADRRAFTILTVT